MEVPLADGRTAVVLAGKYLPAHLDVAVDDSHECADSIARPSEAWERVSWRCGERAVLKISSLSRSVFHV